MAQEVPTAPDGTTLKDIAEGKSYRDQAIFWLNAMWPEHAGQNETVWGLYKLIAEIDEKDKNCKKDKRGVGQNGHDLHRQAACNLFERDGRGVTPIECGKKDLTGNKRISLIEYLVDKFGTDLETLMTRPQGVVEDDHELMDALAAVTKIEDKKAELEAKIADPKTSSVKKNTFKVKRDMVNSDYDARKTELNRAILSAKAKARKRAKNKEAAPGQGLIWWSNREIAEAEGYKPKGDADEVKIENYNEEIKKSQAEKAEEERRNAISAAGKVKIAASEARREEAKRASVLERAKMFGGGGDDQKEAVAQTEAADDAAVSQDEVRDTPL